MCSWRRWASLLAAGDRRRDDIAAERMERFVVKFLKNCAGRRRWFLGVPPPHLWFLAKGPKLRLGDPVPETVRIVRRDIHYSDDGVYAEVTSMVGLEVRLSGTDAAAARRAA